MQALCKQFKRKSRQQVIFHVQLQRLWQLNQRWLPTLPTRSPAIQNLIFCLCSCGDIWAEKLESGHLIWRVTCDPWLTALGRLQQRLDYKPALLLCLCCCSRQELLLPTVVRILFDFYKLLMTSVAHGPALCGELQTLFLFQRPFSIYPSYRVFLLCDFWAWFLWLIFALI